MTNDDSSPATEDGPFGRKTSEPSGIFPPTQWTQVIHVIQNGDDIAARAALDQFCESYHSVVLKFFQLRGSDHEKAKDYTQEFFCSRILRNWERHKGFLFKAQRSVGNFRSFLSSVLWLFLKDEWRHEHAAKAGGQTSRVSLETQTGANEIASETNEGDFQREFDRVFLRDIQQKALARVKQKHSQYLVAHFCREMSQAEAAKALNISENTFKQAYHRFRPKFIAALRAEISQLVKNDKIALEEEIRYLMSLFGRRSG